MTKVLGGRMGLSESTDKLVRSAILDCAKCGTPMWVVHIQYGLDQDTRTYECPGCEHSVEMKIEHNLAVNDVA